MQDTLINKCAYDAAMCTLLVVSFTKTYGLCCVKHGKAYLKHTVSVVVENTENLKV